MATTSPYQLAIDAQSQIQQQRQQLEQRQRDAAVLQKQLTPTQAQLRGSLAGIQALPYRQAQQTARGQVGAYRGELAQAGQQFEQDVSQYQTDIKAAQQEYARFYPEESSPEDVQLAYESAKAQVETQIAPVQKEFQSIMSMYSATPSYDTDRRGYYEGRLYELGTKIKAYEGALQGSPTEVIKKVFSGQAGYEAEMASEAAQASTYRTELARMPQIEQPSAVALPTEQGGYFYNTKTGATMSSALDLASKSPDWVKTATLSEARTGQVTTRTDVGTPVVFGKETIKQFEFKPQESISAQEFISKVGIKPIESTPFGAYLTSKSPKSLVAPSSVFMPYEKPSLATKAKLLYYSGYGALGRFGARTKETFKESAEGIIKFYETGVEAGAKKAGSTFEKAFPTGLTIREGSEVPSYRKIMGKETLRYGPGMIPITTEYIGMRQIKPLKITKAGVEQTTSVALALAPFAFAPSRLLLAGAGLVAGATHLKRGEYKPAVQDLTLAAFGAIPLLKGKVGSFISTGLATGITGLGVKQYVSGTTAEEKRAGLINIGLGVTPFAIAGGRFIKSKVWDFKVTRERISEPKPLSKFAERRAGVNVGGPKVKMQRNKAGTIVERRASMKGKAETTIPGFRTVIYRPFQKALGLKYTYEGIPSSYKYTNFLGKEVTVSREKALKEYKRAQEILVKQLSKKSPVKFQLRDLKIPQTKGEELIKLFGIETKGGRSLLLGGKSSRGVFAGSPNLLPFLKKLPSTTEIKLGSALETKAIYKNILSAPENLVTPRAREIIPLSQRILRATYSTPSKFLNEELLFSATERLPKQGVRVLLDIGKENKGILFGSKSRAFQLAQDYNIAGQQYKLSKVPRDIEFRFDKLGDVELKKVTEQSISRLKKLGTIEEGGAKFELGTAREIKDTPFAIEAKVNGKWEKVAEYKGGGSVIEGEEVPEFVVGIKKVGTPFFTKEGTQATTLAEELRGVSQGVLRLRTSKETGLLDIYPSPKRLKDIGSVSVAARTLERSKFKLGLKKDITAFESLFPESLVREQVSKVLKSSDKVALVDFSKIETGSSPFLYKGAIPSLTSSKAYGINYFPSGKIDYLKSPKTSISSRSRSPSYSLAKSISATISPKISPSTSSYFSSSISPKTSLSISPKISPSISPRVSPSMSPYASPRSSPSVSPYMSPKASLSVSPRVSPSMSPYSPSPKSPPSRSPPPKIIRRRELALYPRKGKLLPRRRTETGYTVQIKRGRKFGGKYEAPLAISLPKEEAFALGARKTIGRAAATFKITPTGRTARAIGIKPTQIERAVFRPGKKAGTFVQRERLRIITPGEKREITYKGLAARRSKRSKPVWGF